LPSECRNEISSWFTCKALEIEILGAALLGKRLFLCNSRGINKKMISEYLSHHFERKRKITLM
jgi:hypothetical protein